MENQNCALGAIDIQGLIHNENLLRCDFNYNVQLNEKFKFQKSISMTSLKMHANQKELQNRSLTQANFK